MRNKSQTVIGVIGVIVITAIFSPMARPQAIDPWLADGLNAQINQNMQEDAKRRAKERWQRDENAILQKIAKLRATPYYGAFAYNYK